MSNNNNTSCFKDEIVKFLEKHKKLLYIVIVGIFIVALLVIFIGSDTLKAINTNDSGDGVESKQQTNSSDHTTTSIITDTPQETYSETSIPNIESDDKNDNLQTTISEDEQAQPETVTESSEENHLLFYSVENFTMILDNNINKIKNSDKIDDYVCNYSKDEDARLLEALKKEESVSSLDDINEVINIRETIYNNNNANPQLANLLGHSYLKKSDFELDSENKLIDLKKSREYFLKKTEFLDPDGDESGYVDVVISSFRIINAEDNTHNDTDLFYDNYIEILSYSTIAQEINPKNNAANYYSAFIYYELYKNTPKNNIQLRNFFKNNAITYYKLVDVSSDYYIKAQRALDLLK